LNNKQITIETYNSNLGIFIKISDNGIGISKENLLKIFDKFYRVNSSNTNAIDGFGLGLAYVYTIITAHKGTITVESKLNEGSAFTVFIPVTCNDY
jgi:two-component system phosphate regulon sensor histidine kinase PhoR